MKIGAYDVLRKESLPYDLRPVVESPQGRRHRQFYSNRQCSHIKEKIHAKQLSVTRAGGFQDG